MDIIRWDLYNIGRGEKSRQVKSMTTIFKNSILGRLKRGQRELSVSSEKTGRYEKMHFVEEERFKRGQRELPS